MSFDSYSASSRPQHPKSGMATGLGDRIRLVARLLTSLQRQGGDAYVRASALQAAAVKGQLSQASLSLEQTTEVVEALAEVPWQCKQHADDVLAALASGPAVVTSANSSPASARRPLQDFTSVVNFFTEEQWEFMFGDAAVPSQKLHMMLEHCHALGLRCASEMTVQRLTTLFVCSSEGVLGAKAMQPSQKLAMTKHIKSELKKLGDGPSAVYLTVLPLMPSELEAGHPDLFRAVFKTKEPVPMKLDLHSFADVLSTVPCRGRKLDSCSAMGSANFNQVAAGFLQQMQQMQQLQMATYHALTGSGGKASGMPKAMASLMPGLSPLPAIEPALQIQDLRPQVQMQPAALQEPPAPSPAAQLQRAASLEPQVQPEPAPATSMQPAPDAAPLAAAAMPMLPVALGQAPKKKARPSVADSIALISSKIDERDACRKEAAKAKAKAKAKAEEDKGKDKGKANADGKNNAKAKISPKAKAKDAPSTTSTNGVFKPCFQVVTTRKLVQCRTGLKGPGQNHSISFASAGDQVKAIAMAKKWVAEAEKKGSL